MASLHQTTSSPLVSVVISAYNRPDLLNEAIRSVLAQSFQDFELIVVDDHSPDSAVSRYQIPEGAALIRLERNYGRSAHAKNVGVEASTGKYVAFLDDDDVWLPGKLAAQVEILESNPDMAMTFCTVAYTDADLNIVQLQKIKPIRPGTELARMLYNNYICSPSTILIRRDCLELTGGFDPELPALEDWDLWLRLLGRHGVHLEDKASVLYRRHGKQATANRRRMLAGRVDIYRKTLEWLPSTPPQLVGLAHSRLCQCYRALARLEMGEQPDYGKAIRWLRLAVGVYPWNVRSYGMMSEAAFRRLARVPKGREDVE